MKINIPKDWIMAKAQEEDSSFGAGNPAVMAQYAFERWFATLTDLATKRGQNWLLGEPASHRASFEEGITPLDELNHLVAEATRNA
jgi:hypothetical protein